MAMASGGCIDVFHGDADGICSFLQLHLVESRPEALLVTGAKREINLLARIQEADGCRIRICDISLDSNRSALLKLLAQGNQVFYVDHHFSGQIPFSPFLEAHIAASPRLCTALIVNHLLAGRFPFWAVVGAFGDNLDEEAVRLGLACGLSRAAVECLRELGQLMNYNAYGLEPEDHYAHPLELCREAQKYGDPLRLNLDSVLLRGLREQYKADHLMLERDKITPLRSFVGGKVFLLPPIPWSRRMAGPLANRLARQSPDQAHAVLTPRRDGQLLVSVRAPLSRPMGADALCRQFPTGGGRSAAAGVNALPRRALDAFLARFDQHFSSPIPSSEFL